MRRIISLIGLFLAVSLHAQNIRELFVAMPDSLSPLLTATNRADFGDFLDYNMKAEVKNRFDKTSEMLKLTDDYLCLRMSSASTVEMKLLPVSDSVKVICAVHTYMAPAPDSRISFYDTQWNELSPEKFIQLPREDDFYLQPDSSGKADELKNLRAHADMYLSKASLSENGDSLKFVYTTPVYMDEETAKKIKPFLKPSGICYLWTDGKFMMIGE